MKLESEFVIAAPDVKVFDNFLDPDVLGTCIPGCELLQRIDDTHYTGVIVNEVAHVKFRAAFSVEITEMLRPKEVVAVMAGEDSRLASSLKVNAALRIAPRDDGSSDVRYEMNVVLWGKLGRMGEAIIRRKTVDIEREFVKRFTAACATGYGAVPVPPAEEALSTDAAASPRAMPAPATVSDGGRPATRVGAPAAMNTAAASSHPPVLGDRAAGGGTPSWWRRLVYRLTKKRSGR